MQSWYLRRCMSIYNDIVRRSHLPREPGIRRIMAETGIDLSLYGPCSNENLENEEPEEADHDDLSEEDAESEDAEMDECS